MPVCDFSARPRTLRDSAVKSAFGGAITRKGGNKRNIKMQASAGLRLCGRMVNKYTLLF